jgi:hypothetical protein
MHYDHQSSFTLCIYVHEPFFIFVQLIQELVRIAKIIERQAVRILYNVRHEDLLI